MSNSLCLMNLIFPYRDCFESKKTELDMFIPVSLDWKKKSASQHYLTFMTAYQFRDVRTF